MGLNKNTQENSSAKVYVKIVVFAFGASLVLLWSLLFLISLNHLYFSSEIVTASTRTLGILFGSTLVLTLLFVSRNYFRQSVLIFFIFLILGYFVGSFIETPADSLGHLNRSYSVIGKSSEKYSKIIAGFWHFSLSSFFLPKPEEQNFDSHLSPKQFLFRVDLLNGFYWALLSVCLYILAKSSGLPNNWAALSLLICFLFFGTNRFSYFRYYSFAPAFTSILIYWLWTAVFFFKRHYKDIFWGLISFLLCLPILAVNHLQEAFFLLLIVLVWLFINAHERLWPKMNKYFKVLYLSGLFVIFFILPQFHVFRELTSKLFVRDLWLKNDDLYFTIHGFHLFGKVFGYRVHDTLGLIGFLPLAFTAFYFFPKHFEKNEWKAYRIITLGIIPFIGYWTPLINFFWIANVKAAVYYRLCYSSMFWITLAFGLYKVGEKYFYGEKKKIQKKLNRNIGNFVKNTLFRKYYFLFCVTLILILSSIRTGPIYGKMDFIALNGRPWWPRWETMINEQLKKERKIIYSDPQTIAVLHGIFNLKSYKKSITQKTRDFTHDPKTVIDLDKINRIVRKKKYRCIINLRGFRSSWVPLETNHWKTGLGNTSLYYELNGLTGDELKEYLMQNPPANCEVYY